MATSLDGIIAGPGVEYDFCPVPGKLFGGEFDPTPFTVTDRRTFDSGTEVTLATRS
ncbi:hypothetical protein [Nocardia jejuensis]|uniref:hypothetical protein n=1 Tax=Nocardia jejuensis TaxID=328049 RepID=UPI000A3F4743|nr:hypothetical protein [Nocardia jejuensis]